MSSDLTDETGALDPGVDRLFRALTGPATPGELAGERDTLAMYRANSVAAALPAVQPAAPPSYTQWWRISLRFPARWSAGLAAALTVALGGATAAAYAAALPAPVQHFAHSVLGFAGVPDTQHGAGASGHARSGHHAGAAPSGVTRQPAGSSAPPASSPTASAQASTGQFVLSAYAASGRIAAGSAAVIDGRLTRSGTPAPGVTVTLVDRLAGQALWHVAGSGKTTTAGNVVISVPVLTVNAVFRLIAPGVPPTGNLLVIVTPQVLTSLAVGQGGLLDSLAVSTEYADAGNIVILQVQAADGGWQYVRAAQLSASGQATFTLSGRWLGNRVVRAVLLGTARHGGAAATPVLVPPPA
jgi:hypothetical protein